MTHGILTIGIVAACLVLGLGALPGSGPQGSAQAAAPGYKVSMIKMSANNARKKVEEGKSPQQDCTMVSMQGKDIIKNYSDDEKAMEVAIETMEICGFEVPVAYFHKYLDTVESKLAETPDSPTPCQDFVTEFAMFFTLIKDGPERKNADGTPVPPAEDRVKAELSERVKKSCPLAAGMMRF
jgi:hypothetical protein